MSKALIQVFCGNMAHQLTRNSYKHLKQKFAKCLSFCVFLTMRSYALKRANNLPLIPILGSNHSPESPKYVFRDPGFALFKGWDSGF